MDYISCTVKELPEELWAAANDTAAQINPANLPRLHSINDSLPLITRIAVARQNYWGSDGVNLTVSFLDTNDQALIKRILDHANSWGEYCNAKFRWTQRDGQLRIARTPGDGHYAYLGPDNLHVPLNQKTMNLDSFTMQTPESEYSRVVRHEFGHVLGCPHEHMRTEIVNDIDPALATQYFWQTQRWDADMVRQQVLTSISEFSIMGTPHAQRTSIMCYGLPGQIMKSRKPVEGGTDITPEDGAFMATLYPKAIVPVSPPPPVAPTMAGMFGFVPDVPNKKVTIYVPEGYTGKIVKVKPASTTRRKK